MQRLACIGAVLASALVAGAAFAGERVRADVTCAATDTKLTYRCRVQLTGRNTGTPLQDANVLIKADMPSMAMAHNVPPVTAEAAGEPGLYTANIELQMYGEWALTIDVSGPTRDRLIHKQHFGAADAAGQTMQHGAMKAGDDAMQAGHGSDMKKKAAE